MALLVLAHVGISVGEAFESRSMSLVIEPTAFIHAAVLVFARSESVSHAVVDLSSINAVFIMLDCKISRQL